MRVPLPTNTISGATYSDAIRFLTPKIVAACGGTQCISVAKKYESKSDDGSGKACDVVDSAEGTEYDPGEEGSGAGYVTVAPGGTIFLLVDFPCADKATTADVPEPNDTSDPTSSEPAAGSTEAPS